jgi:3-oxoacyl-[acyl-carrier-protein] synthase II
MSPSPPSSSSPPRRVAITGLGLLTPLGVGAQETWDGLLAGESAVGPIEGYDASSLSTQLGAEITELTPKEYVDRRALRTMTRHDMLATVAGVMAMRDAGLAEAQDDPHGRFGLFTASGKEISEPEHFQEVAVAVRGADGAVDMRKFGELAFQQVHPLFYIQGLQGASLFYLSEAFMLRGPNTFFAGGAEAGLTAVARGFRAVRRGEADAVLAGGGDSPVNWWNMAKIDSLGLTTRSNELGAGACRPFDAERDGTVMGEGGAFLVLEELERAQARGARVYAEVVGAGSASDERRMFTPDPSGAPLAAAVGRALRDAGMDAGQVGYVAAHGSGTRRGDASEGQALRAAFGEDGTGLAVSSVKPATGHLGAAAGPANAIVAALALTHGVAPSTLNLNDPDPACAGVDLVTGEARRDGFDLALALGRGLEGQNVALAIKSI